MTKLLKNTALTSLIVFWIRILTSMYLEVVTNGITLVKLKKYKRY